MLKSTTAAMIFLRLVMVQANLEQCFAIADLVN